MTYEELKEAIGTDRAILVYDYFVDWTIDNLVQRVLDTYTLAQLNQLGKELNDDD